MNFKEIVSIDFSIEHLKKINKNKTETLRNKYEEYKQDQGKQKLINEIHQKEKLISE